jgi:hypothetical protein
MDSSDSIHSAYGCKNMKRSLTFIIIVGIGVFLLFVYIYQANQYLRESYYKQDLEKQKKKAEQKKQALVHQLYQIKNRDQVAVFAKNELRMAPIALTQIKKYYE